MEIQCFWLEETNVLARSLRRYSRGDAACPADPTRGYHNAAVRIEDDVAPERQVIDLTPSRSTDAFIDDPRWPTRCDCGYEFVDEDKRQVFVDRVMRRTDTGETLTLRDAPTGAMWDAWWLTHGSDIPKPDEIRLMIQTPGGGWYIDDKASNGPGWTRTGDPRAVPPTITASPSIVARDYHGWLRAGKLVDA